ncbi:MAG: MBL fold metallo-hydrolase [Bryobacteraceae bacterium]|jgi:beta-lactamase superfamily II metal-dependent hydrolase
MKNLLLVVLCGLLFAAILPAAKTLDMWVVDSEGAKSLLIVSPAGQSMLIDTGWPGFNGRDTDRILEACKAAGVKKLDVLVISHYDLDHVDNAPGIVAKIPVDLFVDHGPAAVHDPHTTAAVKAYDALWANAKHLVVKPGDKIPFKGAEALIVTSNGEALKTPLKGAGKPNPACAGVERKTWGRSDEDASENGHALSILFTYGKFRMIDMADLTWNRELELMCPNNPIGLVDLFMVGNHGSDTATSPALVGGLRPLVAVMDNGVRKFGAAVVLQTLKKSPGMQAVYLEHWSAVAPNDNPPDEYIANLQTSPDGKWIKISAQSDGAFIVTNTRTGESKTYKR